MHRLLRKTDPLLAERDGRGRKAATHAYDQGVIDKSVEIAARINLTDDAVGSRLKMANEEQTRVTKDSCTNFSSLYTLHGQRCKLLGENSDAIYNEYPNK